MSLFDRKIVGGGRRSKTAAEAKPPMTGNSNHFSIQVAALLLRRFQKRDGRCGRAVPERGLLQRLDLIGTRTGQDRSNLTN
jgi:hypothetical protein